MSRPECHSRTFRVPFLCVSMEILAMFEFSSLFNGAAYLNKQRAVYILIIVLLVHVGCVAVVCPVPEKQAVKNLLSFQQ